MQVLPHRIIVIGTSAGGMDALCRLLKPLTPDLPVSVFIVQHLSVDSNAAHLVNRLSQHTRLRCVVAQHHLPIERSTVYMAPADYHLLVDKTQVLVARGPRENQFRPAIDPLFRSAAAFHGASVTGIILTGFLSDGLVGMNAIKRCGGTTVVQDPADAEYPDLPRTILRHLPDSYTVPIRQMGELLLNLVNQPSPDSVTVPADILMEAQIAQRIMINHEPIDLHELDNLGNRVPYSCPDCGGALWELTQETDAIARFRCHTGHAYTNDSLLLSIDANLEETLYVAMRTLEERRSMLLNMASQDKNNGRLATVQRERADEMSAHIERLRQILEAATLSDSSNQREAG